MIELFSIISTFCISDHFYIHSIKVAQVNVYVVGNSSWIVLRCLAEENINP